ncbi:olfactory receptor 52R1-like [Carettochelys insculpta]|uniref:olfactory receptor 52R1-like n=1 Tax=Carettochelys insculpta TaxID=44489 RepID=UPI003EB9BB49
MAIRDLLLYTFPMPKILSIFWLGSREIEFNACLTQMFFVHAFSSVELSVLIVMALDRNVAICIPLWHSSILSVPGDSMTPQLLAIFLTTSLTSATPEHPLKNAIQSIISAAGATDCWMCTLLNSSTGLGTEFVPLNLNNWWKKSDIFWWGPVWLDDSNLYYHNPQNDSWGRDRFLLLSSMSHSNITDFTNPSTIILLGIPGLEAAYVWLSIPFCIMYAIVLLGNFFILFIVKIESSLHEPMYYFLCMLAITDLVLSSSTLPKMLSIFLFNSREISFSACLTQVFFIHCFAVMESGIFMAVAFDRYVAICHPLRHSTILTNPVVVKIGLAVALRGIMLVLPYPLLLRRWLYCRTNILPYTHCGHMDVLKLACGDTRISSYYGLFVLFSGIGLDMFFIAISYVQILRTIFRLPTKDARIKTFGTCSSHLCAILALYIPNFFSSFTQRFGQNLPLYFHVLIGNVYLQLPPMLNPIIYGVRSKQMRDRVLRLIVGVRRI